jgi:hypothetical protein
MFMPNGLVVEPIIGPPTVRPGEVPVTRVALPAPNAAGCDG